MTIVIPAQAGIQGAGTKAKRMERPNFLGPGLRRNDERVAIFKACFIAMEQNKTRLPASGWATSTTLVFGTMIFTSG